MWDLYGESFNSRLLLGTSRYPSPQVMQEAIKASNVEIITVSLRRESAGNSDGKRFWDFVKNLDLKILPNTAGCFSVGEAVTTAHLARDLFETDWIKLEVLGDRLMLHPDPSGTVEAAKELVGEGFKVFPFITEDLVVAKRLVDLGCEVLMPWGAPIGTGQGILNPFALDMIRKTFPSISLICDAGIGRPSDALQAMELGFDGVLLNTAVSTSDDPVSMASAFAKAVEAGDLAYHAGVMTKRSIAIASSPFEGLADL